MTDDTQTPDTPDEPPEKAAEPSSSANPVRRWTFIVLALCALLLAWYLRADRVTPFTSQARVNALVVPIAPEVSGTITSVLVRNNQPVRAGQELFQIDIERYQLAVQTARANFEAAEQAIGAAKANVAAAEAGIASARAMMERSKSDANRMKAIRDEDPGAISQRRLESADASLAASQGQLAAAEAQREKALQDLGAEGAANSRIQQAQAALDQAVLNLESATVRAPADGVVTGVRLDKGNYAAAGAAQMTFVAASNIWLQADFTENNLGHIKPGDETAIVFDALPGIVVTGTVREVGFGVAVDTAPLGSLPTIKNDPNWLREAQRYPVLIDFRLPPGIEINTIKVGSQGSVVVYTGNHPVINPLSRLLMRLASYLTYAY
jgi:multidrug resistance efflux pump